LDGTLNWQPILAGCSRFRLGEYRAGSAKEATGYYLRIWRKNRAGEWKLALDLLHPR
jgi:ketosteroid isomerase-like protein